MKRTSLMTAILFLMMVLGLASLSSCAKTAENMPFKRQITVLENGDKDWIALTEQEYLVHQHGDSVWVDLSAHRIDNTSDTTMLCVLGDVTSYTLH